MRHIPKSVERLTLPQQWNLAFNFKPHIPNLTHLKFGDGFNHSCIELPASLTHITFGSSFDRPLTCLPNSLTHLTLGIHFNNSIKVLPPKIIYLAIGKEGSIVNAFDQPLDTLPLSLSTLTLYLSSTFNTKHNIIIPEQLEHLTFGIYTQYARPPRISLNIKLCSQLDTLLVDGPINVDTLPGSLKRCSLSNLVTCGQCELPSNLQQLTLHCKFTFMELPPSLTSLDINNNNCYNTKALQHLRCFKSGKDMNINTAYLPCPVTHLQLHTYNKPNLKELPPYVTHLTLIADHILIDNIIYQIQ